MAETRTHYANGKPKSQGQMDYEARVQKSNAVVADQLGWVPETVASFVPGVGEGMSAKAAYDDFSQGNYAAGGLNSLATVAGIIPGVGDLAAKGLGTAAKSLSNKAPAVANVVTRNASNWGQAAGKSAVKTSASEGAAVVDDDEGWDAPPPSGPATQIDSGSPAAPVAQVVNAAPPPAAQQGQQNLMAGVPTMSAPELLNTGGVEANAPGKGTNLGGGTIGPTAAAAALLPNPFLTSGPASAGFAPQLAGLLPSSLGSTATPLSTSQQQKQAAISTTPDRYYDKSNPIGHALGFSGWEEYTPQEKADNINNSVVGREEETEVRVDQNDGESLFYTASDWEQGDADKGTDFTTHVPQDNNNDDDDGWGHTGPGTTWSNDSGSTVSAGYGQGQVDPGLARAAGYSTPAPEPQQDSGGGDDSGGGK